MTQRQCGAPCALEPEEQEAVDSAEWDEQVAKFLSQLTTEQLRDALVGRGYKVTLEDGS